MKGRRTWILAVGTVMVLAAAGVLAQGMHHRGGPGGDEFGFGPGLGFFTDALDLTSAQQDQIKAIWTKEKPAIAPLMRQMRQSHVAMSKLETSDTFNEAQVRAAASQQAQVITELLVQKARIKSEMVQVLTADQKTKLADLQAKHELRMQQHMQKMQTPPTEPPAD